MGPTFARLAWSWKRGRAVRADGVARARALLVDEGYGNDAAAALRRDALDVIAASLDAAAPIVASAVVDAGRDAYPDGAGHFFEMLRFDFVIRADPENELVPTLVEVNASPNVKPASAPQGVVLDRLCAAVAEAIANDDAVPEGFEPVALEQDGALRCASADVRGRALLHHGAEGEDCVWSDWGEWSACPAWCERSRTRTATYPETYHGAHCDGAGRETEPCVDGDCVVASPPPPPTPPSPPEPPPPSTSSTFERILELPALDGEFGIAAQDALIAVVAARTGAAISTVTMVSYEAHATATARVSPSGRAGVDDVREEEWRAMANALAADANVAADRTSLARNVSVAAIRATVHRFGSVSDARESAARLARAMAGGEEGGDGDAGGDGDESNGANGANGKTRSPPPCGMLVWSSRRFWIRAGCSRRRCACRWKRSRARTSPRLSPTPRRPSRRASRMERCLRIWKRRASPVGFEPGTSRRTTRSHGDATTRRTGRGTTSGRGTARLFRRARRRRTERAASS